MKTTLVVLLTVVMVGCGVTPNVLEFRSIPTGAKNCKFYTHDPQQDGKCNSTFEKLYYHHV
jgi:hypothetical protein